MGEISTITASEIFNEQMKLDRNQALKVATIIGHDPNYNREPDYWINVFNTSPIEFIRHRPVDFPTIKIAACPKGDPWILALRVPSTVNYKIISADTSQPSFVGIRGERFATDLINPSNLGEDIWLDSANPLMDQLHGGSDDLFRRGVFWSLNEEPTVEELSKVQARKERHYRDLIDRAEILAGDPKTRNEIGAEHHLAADHLRINASWHSRTEVPVACPNCGEPIKPGVKYHMSSMGPCILSWEGAVAAGVKKREDVPIEKRWWTEPVEPEHRGPGRPRKEIE